MGTSLRRPLPPHRGAPIRGQTRASRMGPAQRGTAGTSVDVGRGDESSEAPAPPSGRPHKGPDQGTKSSATVAIKLGFLECEKNDLSIIVSVCLHYLSHDIRTCVHAHRRGPSCTPGGSQVLWAVGNHHFLVGCGMAVNCQRRRGAIYKTNHEN